MRTHAVRHVFGRAFGRGYEGLVPVDKARRATDIEMHASRHRVSRARWAVQEPLRQVWGGISERRRRVPLKRRVGVASGVRCSRPTLCARNATPLEDTQNSPGCSADATSRRQGHRVLFPCSADRIPRPGPCFSFSPVGCRHELEARCPGLQQKLPQ